MRIEVYLDDHEQPLQVLTPPERFKLDTTKIPDGAHQLRFKAFADSGDISVRAIPFTVHNGPAIVLHGITRNEQLSGEISILANAYRSSISDEFDITQMETPAPIPTWAWLLVLSILAWGAGYISLELHERVNLAEIKALATETIDTHAAGPEWMALGQQVYGNNCAACHQANGSGLSGVFPPLKANRVVIDDDPSTHIQTILNGISGKLIDGIAYASPMPGFSQLSDQEIAAVVNHERTQWGNNATIVNAEDVAKLRQPDTVP